MRKLWLACLIVAGALAASLQFKGGETPAADEPRSVAAAGQNKGDEPKAGEKKDGLKSAALAKFMRAKLGASQLVLEGLALEDFDKIGEGAKELASISSAEKWRVSEDPIYAQHSTDFLRIARRMRKEAEAKNLDGVALNYVQLTMSCVECHRFVRTVLIAGDLRLPSAPPPLAGSN